MTQVNYVERKHTDCEKWDALPEIFGENDLLPMWVADMDFQAPSCVLDALHQYISHGVFGYYRVPDSYYDSFIKWEEKHHGYRVEKDWIHFSPGVVSAFHWLIQFMTKPSDKVLVLTPVYYPFFHAIENNDRKLITSDLHNEGGVYTVDFEDFEKKIVENHVTAFILCSPHNPAGRVWTKEELKTMFDICRKHHVFVISDEIHHDLTFFGHKHTPSFSVGDYQDMMIAITAPSKTFNLAGCQNSIVLIPDDTLRKKWDDFVLGIHVTEGNSFGYIAARAAYEHGEEWLDNVRGIVSENYLFLKEELKKELPDVVVSPLEGTYLAWIDFAKYLKPEELKPFMQKTCGLAFDYGDWFGNESYGTFVRMNLATSRENVARAVSAITSSLKKS